MFRSAWFLMRKDLRYMLRSRETLLWTFIMPIVFFFFIGTITGGFGGTSGVSSTPLVIERPPDDGYLADALLSRLEETGFRLIAADSVAVDSPLSRLTLPPGMTAKVLTGEPVTLYYARQSEGISGNYDQIRIQRSIISVLADVLVVRRDGAEPSRDLLLQMAGEERPLTLAVSQAGFRRKIPTGFEQAIPGTMVMFTLMLMFTSGAILLLIERKEGLLRRLASTPIPRGTIILGKWGGRLALGVVQIGFAMLAGTLIFRMDWGPNVPMLLLLLIVYGGFCALLGMLLGNLARTEGQAVLVGLLISMIIAPLGGCWWPIEITPEWMQKLALVFPTGWAMDAMHKLVSFGAPASSAVPHVAVFLIASLVVGWLAARTFRFT